MRHLRAVLAIVCLAALLIPAELARSQAPGPVARPRRIAVFGSSVAFGTGDETRKEGYTGLLRELLEPRGWQVFNQSKPGDTTITMAPRFSPSGEPAAGVRYLTTVDPGYVVIALSLANEGVLEAPTQEEKARVATQFSDGILKFISQAREHNIVPIVASCYPRMSFTSVEYEFVEDMNLLINQWDVPSINLLGALDDGTGRYVREFDSDDRHPNAAGHKELFYTFVPSLFEALEKGKPRPVRPSAAGFAHAESGTALTFTPQDTVHSFAVSFAARTQANGTAAEIGGSRIGSSPSPFTAGVRVINGKWAYHAADGMDRLSEVSADGKWHEITISHYAARGETLFFIDGMLAGRASEKLSPADLRWVAMSLQTTRISWCSGPR